MSLPFRPADRHNPPCWSAFLLLTALWGCTPEGGPVSEARVESGAENPHAEKDPRSQTEASESGGLVTNLELIQNPTAAHIQKGHDAFYTYGCWHCHPLGDEETPGMPDWENSGPDLADVGRRLSAEAISQSILEPNAVIAEPRERHTDNGQSRMPSFANPEAKEDINCMVALLAQCRLETPQEPTIVKATDSTLESLMNQADGLVLLDFWSEWCFACLEAGPALETVAPSFDGQLKVFKIEVDENPVLVNRYAPDLSFPCFVLMREGKLVDRRYGMDPTQEPEAFFRTWIQQHLKDPPGAPMPEG